MNTYFYYKAIRRTIIQFLDIFNDINIARYDIAGNVLKTVKVPIKFGPKSKAYLYVREQQRNEEMLPMISINLQGISYDPNRIGARHENITVNKTISELSTNYYKNAIPYNLEFNLTIWALHMVDIDQIYEQILPYFAPHIFIRVNVPELDTTVEVKVILESCSPEMTDDLGEEEARVLKWASTFTAQTWLFKPITDSKIIESIYTNYYTDLDTWDDRNTTSIIVTGDTYQFTPSTSGAPSESTAVIALGYDEDAAILTQYEVF